MKSLIVLSLLLTSCAMKEEVKYVYETKPMSITDMVSMENDYRISAGQSILTQGLVCTLYKVPTNSTGIVGTALTTIGSYTYNGTFNQSDSSSSGGLNILPPSLRSLYISWYVVRCTGKIVILDSDYYSFELTSDDGSMLYINGSVVINNDGNHSSLLKSGVKYLKYGVHDFRLDYMQGPGGNQSLILSSSGTIISPEVFYH